MDSETLVEQFLVVKTDSSKKKTREKSKYTGVFKCGKKFKAQIQTNGVQHYLGLFDSEIDAAKAYDKHARSVLGPKAKTNFEYDENEIPEQDISLTLGNHSKQRTYLGIKMKRKSSDAPGPSSSDRDKVPRGIGGIDSSSSSSGSGSSGAAGNTDPRKLSKKLPNGMDYMSSASTLWDNKLLQQQQQLQQSSQQQSMYLAHQLQHPVPPLHQQSQQQAFVANVNTNSNNFQNGLLFASNLMFSPNSAEGDSAFWNATGLYGDASFDPGVRTHFSPGGSNLLPVASLLMGSPNPNSNHSLSFASELFRYPADDIERDNEDIDDDHLYSSGDEENDRPIQMSGCGSSSGSSSGSGTTDISYRSVRSNKDGGLLSASTSIAGSSTQDEKEFIGGRMVDTFQASYGSYQQGGVNNVRSSNDHNSSSNNVHSDGDGDDCTGRRSPVSIHTPHSAAADTTHDAADVSLSDCDDDDEQEEEEELDWRDQVYYWVGTLAKDKLTGICTWEGKWAGSFTGLPSKEELETSTGVFFCTGMCTPPTYINNNNSSSSSSSGSTGNSCSSSNNKQADPYSGLYSGYYMMDNDGSGRLDKFDDHPYYLSFQELPSTSPSLSPNGYGPSTVSVATRYSVLGRGSSEFGPFIVCGTYNSETLQLVLARQYLSDEDLRAHNKISFAQLQRLYKCNYDDRELALSVQQHGIDPSQYVVVAKGSCYTAGTTFTMGGVVRGDGDSTESLLSAIEKMHMEGRQYVTMTAHMGDDSPASSRASVNMQDLRTAAINAANIASADAAAAAAAARGTTVTAVAALAAVDSTAANSPAVDSAAAAAAASSSSSSSSSAAALFASSPNMTTTTSPCCSSSELQQVLSPLFV